jgi:hypothetical protein
MEGEDLPTLAQLAGLLRIVQFGMGRQPCHLLRKAADPSAWVCHRAWLKERIIRGDAAPLSLLKQFEQQSSPDGEFIDGVHMLIEEEAHAAHKRLFAVRWPYLVVSLHCCLRLMIMPA